MSALVRRHSPQVQKSQDTSWWNAPALSSSRSQNGGASGAQAEDDRAMAALAGMGGVHMATLAAFGLRPAELDPEAAPRLVQGLNRLFDLPECGGKRQVSGADCSLDLRCLDKESRIFYQDDDGNYYSGVATVPAWELPLPLAPAPEQAPATQAPVSAEGLTSFADGAIIGGFSENNSLSAIAGQVVLGFVPGAGQVADLRDLLAGAIHLADGKEGALLELGLSALGLVPGAGDLVRGAAKVGMATAPMLAMGLLKQGDELAQVAKGADEAPGLLKSGEEAAQWSKKTRAEFVAELGEEATEGLLSRYGAKALEHYGLAFFRTWQGVTDATMKHLTTVDGVKRGKISGCHDEALFLATLEGGEIGKVVSKKSSTVDSRITEVEYVLFQRDGTGKVIDPPKLRSGTPHKKTLVQDLVGNAPTWRETIRDGLDDAIRRLALPAGREVFVQISGVPWSGYVDNGIVTSIFPVM